MPRFIFRPFDNLFCDLTLTLCTKDIFQRDIVEVESEFCIELVYCRVSASTLRLNSLIGSVAPTDASVLIRGERLAKNYTPEKYITDQIDSKKNL